MEAAYGPAWGGRLVAARQVAPIPVPLLDLSVEIYESMVIGRWYPSGQVLRLVTLRTGRGVKEARINRALQSLLGAAFIMQKVLTWGVPQYLRFV